MQLISSLLVCLCGAVLVQICLSVPPSTCKRCDSSGTCVDLCPVGKRCQVNPCFAPPCMETCVVDNGVCPTLPPGTFGPCVELCSGGGPFKPCPFGQLCCSNGCGHVCESAIYPSGSYK